MKRGQLKRGKRLGADPEKVRAFMQRGRQPLKRAQLARRPQRRQVEGPLTPWEWRERAFVASEGVCVITGAKARNAQDRRFHVHHPLPARELRARGLFGRVWDPRNALWLRRDIHARHELAFARVPHTALPDGVWEFCREVEADGDGDWATQLVLRLHPAR